MTTLEEQLHAQTDAAVQEHEARENRRRIVKTVAHSSAMEGMPLDAETMQMFDRYIDGGMTTEQMREAVLAQYRR